MRPAAASTNRKQMLQEASVSVLGAALRDPLGSRYSSCTTLPCCETPSVGGFTSACSCPASGIYKLQQPPCLSRPFFVLF